MTDAEPVEQESELSYLLRLLGYQWIYGVIEVEQHEGCHGPDNCNCWYKPESKKDV